MRKKLTPTQEMVKAALKAAFNPNYKEPPKKMTPAQAVIKEALQIFQPPEKKKGRSVWKS